MKTRVEIIAIVGQCAILPGLFDRPRFHLKGWNLQLSYMDKDVVTGDEAVQWCRKWYISPHSTETEIVRTAFKAMMTSLQHRGEESFTYKGRRPWGRPAC